MLGADASLGPSHMLSAEVLDGVMVIYQCNWRVADELLIIKTVMYVGNSYNSVFYFKYLLLTVFSKHIYEFFTKLSWKIDLLTSLFIHLYIIMILFSGED